LRLEFADVENRVGIDFGVAAMAQNFFVAGSFAFFHEMRADTSDKGRGTRCRTIVE
jgi:hypothetical protein